MFEPGIIERLSRQRAAEGHRPRLHVVETVNGTIAATPVSLAKLFKLAGCARGALEAAGARPGDRVLLALADPYQFMIWFFAILGGKMIAVPAPPPDQLGGSANSETRVHSIIADCDPRVTVLDHRFASLSTGNTIEILGSSVFDRDGPMHELEDSTLGAPAFLQYTSGSTGEPKGVVVTHTNLVANLRAMTQGMGFRDNDRMFSWLPLHHDMGLIAGVLWPLFAGGETFVMRPFTFISNPVTWLRGITKFGCTTTIAPNFAFSICARKIPDKHLSEIDLSSLRIAICGAEPIDIEVARAFTDRFARHKLQSNAFYPVYGLAEATLAVSASDHGAEVRVDIVDRRLLAGEGRAESVPANAPHAQALVSVGKVLPEHEVEIRDICTGLQCKERQVGEVMVRGPSVSPRFWREGEGIRKAILATGDLGYLADGYLHIVDRLKDLVIIAGQNYSPSDIETAVTPCEGVRLGRVVAFAVRRPETGTEGAVVVAEVDPTDTQTAASIRKRIEDAVRARIGIHCEAVLTTPGAIEKTTSGKVRRRACAARFTAGTLPLV